MDKLLIEATKSDIVHKRIDVAVCQNTENLSRNFIHKLIKEGFITVNGKNVDKNYVLKYADIIKIFPQDPKPAAVLPENIPLDIIYEDNDLLVVNKQKGMVAHPAPGNYTSTLVNALMNHCGDSLSGINGVIRPGIVHRIDKDTSGLLIVAKNDFSHSLLAMQIKEHSFKREYEAIVHGNILKDSGTIDAPIGRDPISRKKMCVTNKCSKRAVTHYRVIKRYGNYTHVRLELKTGRTHQIRVHMAYIGYPLVGDMVYGLNKNKNFDLFQGQCLHARVIGFLHPKNNEYLEITSDLPKYFKNYLKFLND
ncbi:MAG: RluA family pseudouridine synthase [Oscillospiraceae bacterium]|jgi:23S rRNA pseudouridine1911/1915/1917 synthase|nr:RluA family pseudouridine synthase [Oscillospiraceae bacterium]